MPAPLVDRIGFPAGYQDTYKLLMTFDRPDNGQIRVIWGNDIAQKVQPGQPYPYGSILIFEGWSSQRDAQGNFLLDSRGHFVKNALTTIFVQRKKRGFGTAYGSIRNGEWEYVSYEPNGQYASAPPASGSCAQCHLQAGENDFVFRKKELVQGASGAVPNGVLAHYTFVPKVMVAQAASTITFYNSDEFDHNIVSVDKAFNSGLLHPGSSYTLNLAPRTYNYTCTIHTRMSGTIVVQQPAGQ